MSDLDETSLLLGQLQTQSDQLHKTQVAFDKSIKRICATIRSQNKQLEAGAGKFADQDNRFDDLEEKVDEVVVGVEKINNHLIGVKEESKNWIIPKPSFKRLAEYFKDTFNKVLWVVIAALAAFLVKFGDIPLKIQNWLSGLLN